MESWQGGLSLVVGYTLKFHMEPENQPLGKEIPFQNHHFRVPCQTLGG